MWEKANLYCKKKKKKKRKTNLTENTIIIDNQSS